VSRPGPVVRPVKGADAAAIVGLVHRCFREYAEFAPEGWAPPADTGARGRMEVALARPVTGGRVAVADDGGHAGHVLWIPSADSERIAAHAPDIAYLWQLFVEPAHRGTGVAAELIATATVVARDEGYAEMRLLTPKSHARAGRFYEREGWSLLGDWGVDPDLGLPLVEYGIRLREPSGHNEGP
jgi:GNAT superfamily N-acetyltransferase